MTELRTDEKLLAAIQQSATLSLPPDQIERQRLSFVMGAMPMDSEMTREDIREVLKRQRGEPQR
jgi:glutamine synthetase adenylyltransferase